VSVDAPGLIFDLDGTLVDSLPGIAASLNRALASMDLPTHPPDAVRTFIGNGSLMLARRAAPAGVDEARVREVETRFKADYDETWPEGTRPFEGVPELLADLAAEGRALAVLSNKPDPFTVEIVRRLFPRISFGVILGHREGSPLKPDPTSALEAVAALGLTPESCRFIGDSTVDIETARRAGIPPLAVTWGYHDPDPLRAAGAETLAASVSELRRILCGRPALS
jgi:phosphoglycolate phosphatase